MASATSQKLKLLHIIEILKEYSDEDFPVSAAFIIEKLRLYGINAERKAIYDDVDCLIDFGYDIIKVKSPRPGYILGERDFELPEIYLLEDAVRTAHFITEKKTRDLCTKLDGMLSLNATPGIFILTLTLKQKTNLFFTILIRFPAPLRITAKSLTNTVCAS